VITEYDTDAITPSMMLSYDTRKSAELAMNKGRIFGESTLDIKWAGPAHGVVGPGGVDGTASAAASGDQQSKNGDTSTHGGGGNTSTSIEDDEAGFLSS